MSELEDALASYCLFCSTSDDVPSRVSSNSSVVNALAAEQLARPSIPTALESCRKQLRVHVPQTAHQMEKLLQRCGGDAEELRFMLFRRYGSEEETMHTTNSEQPKILCSSTQNGQIPLKERLLNYFQHYNLNGEIQSVDALASAYDGKEEVLFAALRFRHGPEPPPPMPTQRHSPKLMTVAEKVCAILEVFDPEQLQHLDRLLDDQDNQSDAAKQLLLQLEVQYNVTDQFWDQRCATPPPIELEVANDTGADGLKLDEFEKMPSDELLLYRVKRILNTYAPSDAENAEQYVAAYEGKGGSLIDALVAKFGPEPPLRTPLPQYEQLDDAAECAESVDLFPEKPSTELQRKLLLLHEDQVFGEHGEPAPQLPDLLQAYENDEEELLDALIAKYQWSVSPLDAPPPTPVPVEEPDVEHFSVFEVMSGKTDSTMFINKPNNLWIKVWRSPIEAIRFILMLRECDTKLVEFAASVGMMHRALNAELVVIGTTFVTLIPRTDFMGSFPRDIRSTSALWLAIWNVNEQPTRSFFRSPCLQNPMPIPKDVIPLMTSDCSLLFIPNLNAFGSDPSLCTADKLIQNWKSPFSELRNFVLLWHNHDSVEDCCSAPALKLDATIDEEEGLFCGGLLSNMISHSTILLTEGSDDHFEKRLVQVLRICGCQFRESATMSLTPESINEMQRLLTHSKTLAILRRDRQLPMIIKFLEKQATADVNLSSYAIFLCRLVVALYESTSVSHDENGSRDLLATSNVALRATVRAFGPCDLLSITAMWYLIFATVEDPPAPQLNDAMWEGRKRAVTHLTNELHRATNGGFLVHGNTIFGQRLALPSRKFCQTLRSEVSLNSAEGRTKDNELCTFVISAVRFINESELQFLTVKVDAFENCGNMMSVLRSEFMQRILVLSDEEASRAKLSLEFQWCHRFSLTRLDEQIECVELSEYHSRHLAIGREIQEEIYVLQAAHFDRMLHITCTSMLQFSRAREVELVELTEAAELGCALLVLDELEHRRSVLNRVFSESRDSVAHSEALERVILSESSNRSSLLVDETVDRKQVCLTFEDNERHLLQEQEMVDFSAIKLEEASGPHRSSLFCLQHFESFERSVYEVTAYQSLMQSIPELEEMYRWVIADSMFEDQHIFLLTLQRVMLAHQLEFVELECSFNELFQEPLLGLVQDQEELVRLEQVQLHSAEHLHVVKSEALILHQHVGNDLMDEFVRTCMHSVISFMMPVVRTTLLKESIAARCGIVSTIEPLELLLAVNHEDFNAPLLYSMTSSVGSPETGTGMYLQYCYLLLFERLISIETGDRGIIEELFYSELLTSLLHWERLDRESVMEEEAGRREVLKFDLVRQVFDARSKTMGGQASDERIDAFRQHRFEFHDIESLLDVESRGRDHYMRIEISERAVLRSNFSREIQIARRQELEEQLQETKEDLAQTEAEVELSRQQEDHALQNATKSMSNLKLLRKASMPMRKKSIVSPPNESEPSQLPATLPERTLLRLKVGEAQARESIEKLEGTERSYLRVQAKKAIRQLNTESSIFRKASLPALDAASALVEKHLMSKEVHQRNAIERLEASHFEKMLAAFVSREHYAKLEFDDADDGEDFSVRDAFVRSVQLVRMSRRLGSQSAATGVNHTRSTIPLLRNPPGSKKQLTTRAAQDEKLVRRRQHLEKVETEARRSIDAMWFKIACDAHWDFIVSVEGKESSSKRRRKKKMPLKTATEPNAFLNLPDEPAPESGLQGKTMTPLDVEESSQRQRLVLSWQKLMVTFSSMLHVPERLKSYVEDRSLRHLRSPVKAKPKRDAKQGKPQTSPTSMEMASQNRVEIEESSSRQKIVGTYLQSMQQLLQLFTRGPRDQPKARTLPKLKLSSLKKIGTDVTKKQQRGQPTPLLEVQVEEQTARKVIASEYERASQDLQLTINVQVGQVQRTVRELKSMAKRRQLVAAAMAKPRFGFKGSANK